tara:strand:- start:2645 stop:3175 length:531 start_codon:yes stop_codon:yes gene_type:complete
MLLSTVWSGIAQSRREGQSRRLQERNAADKRRLAVQNARLQRQELAIKQEQEWMAIQSELSEAERRSDAAIGTATVVAGEAGAFGGSYEALVSTYRQSQDELRSAAWENTANSREAFALGLGGLDLGLDADFVNARLGPKYRHDWLGTGLGVAAYGAQGYASRFKGGIDRGFWLTT